MPIEKWIVEYDVYEFGEVVSSHIATYQNKDLYFDTEEEANEYIPALEIHGFLAKASLISVNCEQGINYKIYKEEQIKSRLKIQEFYQKQKEMMHINWHMLLFLLWKTDFSEPSPIGFGFATEAQKYLIQEAEKRVGSDPIKKGLIEQIKQKAGI